MSGNSLRTLFIDHAQVRIPLSYLVILSEAKDFIPVRALSAMSGNSLRTLFIHHAQVRIPLSYLVILSEAKDPCISLQCGNLAPTFLRPKRRGWAPTRFIESGFRDCRPLDGTVCLAIL
jgi:hypothetical protein